MEDLARAGARAAAMIQDAMPPSRMKGNVEPVHHNLGGCDVPSLLRGVRLRRCAFRRRIRAWTAQTKYAKTVDGVHIAYQVREEGPVDLVYIVGFSSSRISLNPPQDARERSVAVWPLLCGNEPSSSPRVRLCGSIS